MLILLLINMVESRVFCQDSNATPWVTHGYTCPVICASVRNAVERLIMLDYEKTVQEQLREKKIEREEVIHQNDFNLRRAVNNSIDNAELKSAITVNNNEDDIINKIVNSKVFKNAKGILRRNSNALANIDENEPKKCWFLNKFHHRELIGKIVRKKCTRKSNFDAKFLSIMTNVLNKHSHSNFKFNEDMTEILLENIFGKNTDLRNNIFDVNKLLMYLKKAVDLHKSHTQNVITLKSRHCMTFGLPGCFCKTGYVENSGQCVLPSDCVNDHQTQYLSRIIIL